MNTFWPVYKNLESEFLKMTYYIHIDDHQLGVYSSKIAELLLRTVVEIESISKILYVKNGGSKTDFIKYDEDAIKLLNQQWLIDQKPLLITLANCFISNKELYPFIKNVQRTGKNTMTYSWNNAYQNIKHDRANNLKDANIQNLIDGLAALFLLNLYYSDLIFKLEKDSKGLTLSPNMGSEIFAIMIHQCSGHDNKNNYVKHEDFDKCIYYINFTEETAKIFFDSIREFKNKATELAYTHPKMVEFLKNSNQKIPQRQQIIDLLGLEDYMKITSQAAQIVEIKSEQLEYEARLNKNDI